MNRNVLPFYIDGRNDMADGGPGVEVDAEAIAKEIVSGKKPNEVVRAACTAVLAKSSSFASPERKKWLHANKKEIADTGAAASDAWEAYCAGRVDELCLTVETETVNAITTELGLDDDEEVPGEDDEEGDDDGDEDEDGDKERD